MTNPFKNTFPYSFTKSSSQGGNSGLEEKIDAHTISLASIQSNLSEISGCIAEMCDSNSETGEITYSGNSQSWKVHL